MDFKERRCKLSDGNRPVSDEEPIGRMGMDRSGAEEDLTRLKQIKVILDTAKNGKKKSMAIIDY